jgi:hypothetical protein
VYGDTIAFFYDHLGGTAIGCSWNPLVRQSKPFRALLGYTTKPEGLKKVRFGTYVKRAPPTFTTGTGGTKRGCHALRDWKDGTWIDQGDCEADFVIIAVHPHLLLEALKLSPSPRCIIETITQSFMADTCSRDVKRLSLWLVSGGHYRYSASSNVSIALRRAKCSSIPQWQTIHL